MEKMKGRKIMSYNARGLFGWLVVLALLVSTPALAGDVDDLKAAFEKGVKGYNSRDENVFATVHDQHVDFSATVPFAIVGKAPYQQNTKAFWASTESATIKPINPQFLVVGSTGIAWGHCAVAFKPKDGPQGTYFFRYTFTYAKSGGKWVSVASHVSSIP
jgi:ketosteroid isomerase-like protein